MILAKPSGEMPPFFFLGAGVAFASASTGAFAAFFFAHRAFCAAASFARCSAENPDFLALTTGVEAVTAFFPGGRPLRFSSNI